MPVSATVSNDVYSLMVHGLLKGEDKGFLKGNSDILYAEDYRTPIGKTRLFHVYKANGETENFLISRDKTRLWVSCLTTPGVGWVWNLNPETQGWSGFIEVESNGTRLPVKISQSVQALRVMKSIL